MEKLILPTNLLQKNLNSLLFSFESNGISIQFDSPKNLEEANIEFNRLLYDNYLNFRLSSDLVASQYDLNILSKKIEKSRSIVRTTDSIRHTIFTTNHHSFLEKLSTTTLLKIETGPVILEWDGCSFFDYENYLGCGYVPYSFFGDDLEKFYKFFNLQKLIPCSEYTFPERIFLGKNDPEYISIVTSSSDSIFELFKYENRSIEKYIEKYLNFTISFDVNLITGDIISIETQLFSIEEFVANLSIMSEMKCFNDQIRKNISELVIPNNIIFAGIQYHNYDKLICKFYTEDTSSVEQTVFKLSHTA